MKTVMAMLSVAALSGVMVSAHAGSMDKAQMDQTMMKDGMTVSGCVAAGKNAGEFMLTNAMMASAMGDKDKMAMGDKDKMAKPGMSGEKMSYQLVGGENLKAHMGHKVEVTGMMDKAAMDSMGKMSEKEKMSNMAPMKLQVKSVKMISATCP